MSCPDPRASSHQEEPSLKLPTFLLPFLLENLEPDVRQSLSLCVHREFPREKRSSPQVMVCELNESLLVAGVANDEAHRFLSVFLQCAPFPLSEMPQYWLALQALYPENESIKHEVEALSRVGRPLPPGGLSVCFYSSAGALSDFVTTLNSEKMAGQDDDWTPKSLDELPIDGETGVLSAGKIAEFKTHFLLPVPRLPDSSSK